MATQTENKRNTVLETAVLRHTETGHAEGVTFLFSTGQEIQLMFSDISEEMRLEALAHGLKAKIQDGAAIPRDTLTGKSATPEEKHAACLDIAERIRQGEWNKKAEAGAPVSGGLLLAAMRELYPAKTVEELKSYLDRKSAVEKTALRGNTRVAAIIERIKATQGAKKSGVDSEALLGELED